MSKNDKDKHLKNNNAEPKENGGEVRFLGDVKKAPIFSRSAVSLLISILFMSALDIWCYLGLLHDHKAFMWLFAGATAILILLTIIFFCKAKMGWLKANFVIIVIAFVFTWGYYLFVVFDLIKYLTDASAMEEALRNIGWWKYLVFFALQFLQVTFIPLPAMVTTVAGSVLFGPGIATLLSLAGIMLGSIVAFIIGDKCGERVVAWIIGEKQMKKYSTLLFDKGKYIFFLMMLFPLFPDDILCLVAGMTTMSFRFFLITIILTRPIGIVMTCYLSVSIPYHGWGLAVWAVLIIIIVFAFWLSYKYKDQIEAYVTKLSEKFSRRFGKKSAKQILVDNAPKTLLLPEKTETDAKDDIKSAVLIKKSERNAKDINNDKLE